MVRRIPLVPTSVRWLLVGLVAGGILVASVTRSGAVGSVLGPLGILGIDKYLHGLAYAGLATVLAYAMADWRPPIAAIAVFVVAAAFGLGVELVQLPLPYRQFSLLDLVANATGATVVALGWGVLGHRLRFRQVEAVDIGAIVGSER